MTKEQIKSAIAQKIAGQGDQVDISGALASVLDEIVDGLPAQVPVITANLISFATHTNELSKAEAEEKGFTAEAVETIKTMPIPSFIMETGTIKRQVVLSYLDKRKTPGAAGPTYKAVFTSGDKLEDFAIRFNDDGSVTITETSYDISTLKLEANS